MTSCHRPSGRRGVFGALPGADVILAAQARSLATDVETVVIVNGDTGRILSMVPYGGRFRRDGGPLTRRRSARGILRRVHPQVGIVLSP